MNQKNCSTGYPGLAKASISNISIKDSGTDQKSKPACMVPNLKLLGEKELNLNTLKLEASSEKAKHKYKKSYDIQNRMQILNNKKVIDMRKSPVELTGSSEEVDSSIESELQKRARKFVGSMVISKKSKFYKQTHSGSKLYTEFGHPGSTKKPGERGSNPKLMFTEKLSSRMTNNKK